MNLQTEKDEISIGLIGFGEAAYFIAQGLHEHGFDRICAYYHRICSDDPKVKSTKEKASDAGVRLVDSLESFANEASIIINLTNTNSALSSAQEILPFLTQRHTYIDLNSCKPSVKKQIAELLDKTGSAFVDGVLMAPVPLNKLKTPILACGERREAIGQLASLGMRIEWMEGPVGTASGIKMMRSVFMKGMAAVCIETLLTARLNGIGTGIVLDGLRSTFASGFDVLFERLVLGSVEHAERRVHEMEDVISVQSDVGLVPVVTVAIKNLLAALAKIDAGKIDDIDDDKLLRTLQAAYQSVEEIRRIYG